MRVGNQIVLFGCFFGFLSPTGTGINNQKNDCQCGCYAAKSVHKEGF